MVGETFQRAYVSAFHGGFRAAHARRTLSQVYGPLGTYDGGRDKAPPPSPAVSYTSTTASKECKKSCTATFTFPINLGSAEKISINQLVDVVDDIAGIKLRRKYKLDAPKGLTAGTATIP